MSELFHTFGLDWRLLLAQVANFGVVLVGLWYFLYRPVIATLEKRRELIARGVEDARRAEEKLSGADAKAAERVRTAESEAEGVVARARAAASAEKSALLDEARLRAGGIERDAAARAAEESARMLRQSEQAVARLAVLAAEKVMRQRS